MRKIILGLAVPVMIAAAPASNDFLKQPLMAEATITPGQQSGGTIGQSSGFTPAPMPDLDRDVPLAQQYDPNAPHVAPKLFHKQTTYHGEGYVFGSTVQDEHDKRIGPTPGVDLVMPLQ